MKSSTSLLRFIVVAAGLFISFSRPSALRAETVTEPWPVARTNSSPTSEEPAAVVVDSAGNAVVTGFSLSGSSFDFYTAKYRASDGLPLWPQNQRFDGGGEDEALAVAVDSAGNVAVTGKSTTDTSGYDWLTIKYDGVDGHPIWSQPQRFSSPGQQEDVPCAVVTDSAGNVVVAGNFWLGATRTIKTIKYAASTGAILWEKDFALGTAAIAFAHAMTIDSAGNVIIAGYIVETDTEYLILKRDGTTGDPIGPARRLPARGFPYSVAVNPAGDIAVTGESQDPDSGINNLYVAKIAGADGSVWERRNSNHKGVGYSVAIDPAGAVAVTGQLYAADLLTSAFYTVKYAADGTFMWEKTRNGSTNSDVGVSVKMDASGNVYAAGDSSNGSNFDFYTVKYGSAAPGTVLWEKSYDGPGHGQDQMYHPSVPYSPHLALAGDGSVIITGRSDGDGTGPDFATIRYSQPEAPPPSTTLTLQKPSPTTGGFFGSSVASTLR